MASSQITPDQVLDQSLDQILGTDEEGVEAFQHTVNLVRMVCFSRYPAREIYARRLLDEYYTTSVQIETIEEGPITFAYIRFNNIGKYILVGRYAQPVLEEMPDDNEIQKWDN